MVLLVLHYFEQGQLASQLLFQDVKMVLNSTNKLKQNLIATWILNMRCESLSFWDGRKTIPVVVAGAVDPIQNAMYWRFIVVPLVLRN